MGKAGTRECDKVQCIIGDGHVGFPPTCEQADTHHCKHSLLATPLAGGKDFHSITILFVGVHRPCEFCRSVYSLSDE